MGGLREDTPAVSHDFIVVGAGSAGCAVAGRLASESPARVLLIESGGSDRRLSVRVPLMSMQQFGTSLDWNHETEPEPGCAGRRITEHCGRVLGGTSAMNAMVWVRGSDLDYDGWGVPGWNWPQVAPVFARIEQGPMRITRTAFPDELTLRFVEAARAAGIAADDDVSGPELDGAALSPLTLYEGQRWNTRRGYLTGQPNLSIVTRADVHRILIDKGRAVGVEYRRRGKLHQAFADHEVIVSTGALGTPRLLQVSGIGPADHLRSVGVAPVLDSPRVGQGLTDHPHAWAVWHLAPGYTGLADIANPKWLAQWMFGHRGKFANSGVEAVAHIRSAPELPACDFQLFFVPADALAVQGRGKRRPAVSVGHSYWTPASRGSVMIRSADATVAPRIRLNLLSERADLDALVRAVERTREIMATEPISGALEREVLPGPDTDIEQSIRATAVTTYHPSCSVAMGAGPDSALDERLRVRGIDGLRVADASALPRIPRANTNAPSIMLGERCADFLIDDNR